MKNKIHEAFQQIHAEESLKTDTKIFLQEKRKTLSRKKPVRYRYIALASFCLFFLLIGFGGWRLYFTPTAAISIDINPSLELSVNRFNKVLSIKGYNIDGKQLADSLHLKYMDYEEAVDKIVQSQEIKDLLSDDEVLTFTVSGKNNQQRKQIFSNINTSAKKNENTYCYMADEKDTEEAHHLGLSTGRYQALLKLQSLGSDLTAEDVKNMTMKEIHDLIHSLSGEDTSSGQHHSEEHTNRQNTSSSTSTHHQETHTASSSTHHQETQSTSSYHHQSEQKDSGSEHSRNRHNSEENHHE